MATTNIKITINHPMFEKSSGQFELKGNIKEAVEGIADMLQHEGEFKDFFNQCVKRANEMRSKRLS